MTVMMIRVLAKELAGKFFEEADGGGGGGMWSDTAAEHARSKAFRDTYPTLSDFLKGFQRCRSDFAPELDAEGNPPFGYFRVQGSDRWWKKDRPGWHYHVEHARKLLASQLNDPAFSQHEKEAIAAALIEENSRATDPQQSEQVLQRRMAGKTQIN